MISLGIKGRRGTCGQGDYAEDIWDESHPVFMEASLADVFLEISNR